MKSLSVFAVALAVALSVVSAQAALVTVEDFEAYTVDTSIHLQGDDGGIPRWYCQDNTDWILTDHTNSNVRNVGGNQVLEIVNRGADGGIDTVNTAMAVWAHRIDGQGTIYLQYLANGTNDCIMCTNDRWAGFGDYSDPSLGVLDGYQPVGSGAYGPQGALVRLSGDEDFRARDGGGYVNVAAGLTSGVWQEMWIQVDAANDQVKYYVAVNGGAPQQMMSGDEWWGYRDTSNDAVENIEFNMGAGAWPPPAGGFTEELVVLVDNICIDTGAWTLDRLPLPPTGGQVCIPGDADCDGDVDLDDFVALKLNFGTGDEWAEGDFDGDQDVDLDDFVILKNNFGATAN